MNQLPGIAGEIEAIIGLDLTVQLLKARGGTEIVIPKNPDNTVLSEIIGAKATSQLIKDLGSGKLDLPCASLRGTDAEIARRKTKAVEMLKAGSSISQTALACDLSGRTVRRYSHDLQKAENEKRQGRLFL